MDEWEKALINGREQVQDSLITFFSGSGLSDELITKICQCVVDYYNMKIEQYKSKG